VAWKIEDAVSQMGYAPKDWQAAPPSEAWGGRRVPVRNSPDLERVVALPRRALELDGTPRADAIVQAMSERYSRGVPRGQCRCAEIDPERYRAEGCIDTMRLTQALALWEIGIAGGLLGPIGTGHGKTMLDLLAPAAFAHHAGIPDVLCVLFVPPGLVKQLVRDYDYIGQHMRMPTMVIQGSPETRVADPVLGVAPPRLNVMPYSRISLKDSTTWLSTVRPHAIIADEVHKLRDRKTATTKRVMRYFDEYRETRFAGWSGSITSKSIADYAHLAALALKGGSPLPIDPETVDEWARAVDPSDNPADPGALLDGLIASGCCKPGESLYTGISRRILETRGVVSTSSQAVDCELVIAERKVGAIPPHIRELISKALDFERPDGEELVTAMQAVACAIEIACGFHHRWIYPKHVFPRDAQLVQDWLGARKEWNKELRSMLKAGGEHMDSPLLLEHAAERFHGYRPQKQGLPTWGSLYYRAWRDIKPLVKYQPDPVRIDDYLVRSTAEWMAANRGIVWCAHVPFGEWLHELTGYPNFGGGDAAKLALLGDHARGIVGERGERSVICSIKALGTGTNGLQFYFSNQLFANGLPPDPAACEQTLARLHRPNQVSKTVRAEFHMHTAELRKHVKAALRATSYVEGTTRQAQKLSLASESFADLFDGSEEESE
jgi:hypothetical protein